MKKSLTFIVIALTVSILLIGNTNAQNKTATKTTNSQKQKSAKFVIDFIEEDEEGHPKSKVFVSVNKKKTQIMAVYGEMVLLDDNSYMDMEIPKNALGACGGWYAGQGDYFYMVPSKKGIQIFHGWLEESNYDEEESEEDLGYHWEKVEEIVL